MDGYYDNRITLLTGPIYTLPYVGRGIKIKGCNEVQDTAPECQGIGINFMKCKLAGGGCFGEGCSHRKKLLASPESLDVGIPEIQFRGRRQSCRLWGGGGGRHWGGD